MNQKSVLKMIKTGYNATRPNPLRQHTKGTKDSQPNQGETKPETKNQNQKDPPLAAMQYAKINP
jgi:hypothetical protein